MSSIEIRTLLQDHLLALDPTFPTAYENVPFEPEKDVPYQAISLRRGTPENPTFGDSSYRENGFFRVRLLYPQGVGSGQATQKAETIRNHFFRSLTLTDDNLDLIIRRTPDISTGVNYFDRYMVTVDINYFASVFKD